MNRRTVRILRTAVITTMALVFVGCSEKGCAPDSPYLAIANDTYEPVTVRVTGGGEDRSLNMLPESKHSFRISYDTVYDVRILSDAFAFKLTRKRDSVLERLGIHGPDKPLTQGDVHANEEALWKELRELDQLIKEEGKPEKAVASCQAGPTKPPADSGSIAETRAVHLYANILRDPNGKFRLQCGKR